MCKTTLLEADCFIFRRGSTRIVTVGHVRRQYLISASLRGCHFQQINAHLIKAEDVEAEISKDQEAHTHCGGKEKMPGRPGRTYRWIRSQSCVCLYQCLPTLSGAWL